MISRINKSKEFIDYFFWILLILFSNPGGIQQAMNITELGVAEGSTNLNDVLFVFLSICYFSIKKHYSHFDIDFIKITKYLLFFLVYFFIVFGYLTPTLNDPNYSFSFTIIKLRYALYSVFLFLYSYEFICRNSELFLKLFLITSIFVLLLFLQSLLTNSILLPYDKLSRQFFNLERHFLFSYGFLPLLIPLGIVYFVFKIKNKFSKLIVICFMLMSLTWVVSITRRHIIGIFIYFFLALILENYFNKKVYFPIYNIVRVSIILLLVVITTYFVFPKYIEGSLAAINETIHIIEYGETIEGYKDQRLEFKNEFLIGKIKQYPFFGTGFNNLWRTDIGDKAGYEASDYPLLAAFAMAGIFGVLTFLPIYILIIKFIKKDILFLRSNQVYKYNSIELLLFVLFLLYFVFLMLQYINWFLPVSNYVQHEWYIYLAFYLGARRNFYLNNYNFQNRINL